MEFTGDDLQRFAIQKKCRFIEDEFVRFFLWAGKDHKREQQDKQRIKHCFVHIFMIRENEKNLMI